jgi:2-polyprenyl-3-methyl-5-hydroxy-6-metoxy-1,4-benzoquinol methylase
MSSFNKGIGETNGSVHSSETHISCPLCGSAKNRRRELIDIKLIVELWERFFKIDITTELNDAEQIELRQCSQCRISFFLPQSVVGSGDMYAQLENVNDYYSSCKWEYDVALKDLHGREKVLEIGCGSGRFIALAKGEAGISIEGLELNERAINQAVLNGLSVRNARAETVAKESPQTYDAVCSFQVVEHVPMLGDFLRTCCSLLKRGGVLIAAMPNQRSYIRHLVNPLDMPPHHLTRWTRDSIVRIQDHFPLKLIRTAYEPLPEKDIQLFVDTYDGLMRRRGLQYLIHPWVRTRVMNAIGRFGVNRFLRGQNMYACYVRI